MAIRTMVQQIIGGAHRRHPNRVRNWVGPQTYDPDHLRQAIKADCKAAYLKSLKNDRGSADALESARDRLRVAVQS